MSPDPWLVRWLPLVVERAAGAVVLELGCGIGDDTATLVSSGLDVIALDHSRQALAVARTRASAARYVCQDVRAPLPVEAGDAGAVVASLSLHYFSWVDTVALVQRVREVLRTGGVLLCRLNSTEDHHFGASGHPPIEECFYSVKGEPKRFFDKMAIDRLFAAGWTERGVEKMVSKKYLLPKVLWEVVLEKDGS